MKLTTADAFKHLCPENALILSPAQVQALQRVELDMLEDIVDCCERHHLPYCLGGGTALGAVRHHGFIPWDDDVDVNIPRSAYADFIRFFRAEYGRTYWVHTPEDTPGHGLMLAQVRKKHTSVRTREDFSKTECGATVDIFIVENTPDNRVLRFFHGFIAMGLGYALSCRKFFRDRKDLIPMAEGNPSLRRLFRFKIGIGALCCVRSVDGWTRAFLRWNQQWANRETKDVTVPIGRAHYFGEIMPRDAVNQYRQVPFEGRMMNVAADVEEYLTHLYGDWQAIPPESQREQHVVFKPFYLDEEEGQQAERN